MEKAIRPDHGKQDHLEGWKARAEAVRTRIKTKASLYPGMFARYSHAEPLIRGHVETGRRQTAEFLSQITLWLERVPEAQRLGVEHLLYEELSPILAGCWNAAADLAFDGRGLEAPGPT